MKRWIVVCLFALSYFFALPVNAQEARKLPIAVLGLSPKGNVSESDASILTDRIRTLIVQSGRFEIMERESMDKILKEQGFQTTQNCDTNACSIEIGRLLSVRGIVTGSISRLGSIYSLTARVIDVERGTILKEEFVDCNCGLETLLLEKVSPLVSRLLGLNSVPVNEPVSNQPDNSNNSNTSGDSGELIPVRRLKPWLIGAEGGYINFGGLSAQYNLNEYFALRLGSSYGMKYDYISAPNSGAYSPSDSSFIMIPNSYGAINLNGGIKAYFNPQEFAGFAELYGSTSLWAAARLGAEYRNFSGFTAYLAAGWGFSFSGTYANNPDIIVGLGYAF